MAVSPVGPLATGFVLAALTFASFAAAAAIEGVSIFSDADGSVAGLSPDAWAAVVIALFAWAFISANEIAGQRTLKDIYALAPKLTGLSGDALLQALEPSAKRKRDGWIAAAAGLVLGAVLYIGQRNPDAPELGYFDDFGITAWWGISATMVLTSLIVRWVVMARGETSHVTNNLLDQAQLDLLSQDDARMVGRIALRGALVWLLHAAILFLLFVGRPLNAVLILNFLAIVAIAVMVFVTPLALGPSIDLKRQAARA